MTATHPPEPSNPRLERLSDQALLSDFNELVRQDQHHVASLLRHIDVIDRRKLWATMGHSSLFDFLVRRYHMSESTAGKRIGAARTARRFPILFTMVARGEIHLSGIHCLKAHLTRENHGRVLALAKHKTIREMHELVARLAPQPDVPTLLRALPNSPNPPRPAPVPPRNPDPTPLAPGRYKLQVTINQSTRDKLRELQDLLAHQIPNGDLAVILERALDALLVQIHKRKTGITAKPRAPRAGAAEDRAGAPRAQAPRDRARSGESTTTGGRTRHLPVSSRREVWPRDDGRCGFVGEDGHRCNATRGLQFAHRQPWAKGGADTADNLGLRCPAHNALEADRDYGASFMAHKRARKPLKVREPLARYVLRDAARVAATSGATTHGGPGGQREDGIAGSSEILLAARAWP
ncbi:MAG TPA: HNH endonuclease signature motif containing protein [Polyangiaceae bacterium]